MIKINKDALIDFIWMSCRYCIGRSTIASTCHPQTIADILLSNPKCIEEERIEFFAYDIRSEIMSILRWKDCVNEEGFIREWDGYTECLCSEEDLTNKVFTISNDERKVFATPNLNVKDKIDKEYIDLIPWVKLANWLDKKSHKILTIEYEQNGETITEQKECYCYPIRKDGVYVKVWDSVDKFSIHQVYIAPEYIKDIK